VFTSGDAFQGERTSGREDSASTAGSIAFLGSYVFSATLVDWCRRCINGESSKRAPVSFNLHQERQRKMKTVLARLWKEEEGQDLTEYALLLVLIALASMAALTPLAKAINSVFSNAAVNLNAST
jgi:pilus assembly protein Flp/PilA